jgi:hypothetical protein
VRLAQDSETSRMIRCVSARLRSLSLKVLPLRGLSEDFDLQISRIVDFGTPVSVWIFPQECPFLLSERTVDRVDLSHISLGLCSFAGEESIESSIVV